MTHTASRITTILFLTFLTLLFTRDRADALAYSFSVDQFTIEGNLPGSFADDFNDGVVLPWFINDPTIVEANGFVTFSNPGTINPPDFLDGLRIVRQETYLQSPTAASVSDQDGNFIGTSRWAPTVPGLNQHYGMDVAYPIGGPDLVEDFFVHVGNFEPDVAALFGFPTGLIVAFGDSPDGGSDVFQAVSINQADITGDILFQITFDDTANTFDGAFSLDGGTTFQTPFNSFASNMTDPNSGTWFLGAESWDVQAVPEPGGMFLLLSGLFGLTATRNKKV